MTTAVSLVKAPAAPKLRPGMVVRFDLSNYALLDFSIDQRVIVPDGSTRFHVCNLDSGQFASLPVPQDATDVTAHHPAYLGTVARWAEDSRQRHMDALRAANDRARELDTFRDRVRDRMIEEAEERNWCDEFDRIMEELGMEPRVRDHQVTVTITVTANVEASDEDSAVEDLENAAINTLRRNLSYDNLEVEGA